MKKKISLQGTDARQKLLDGVKKVASMVKRTYGPYGKNFASGVRGGVVKISNDGVSLAKEIQGADEFEDIGVRSVVEAATKTNDKAGDGTTSAVILTEAILDGLVVEEGASSKNNVIKALKQVEVESKEVVAQLEKMARPVETREHLIKIARVSVEDVALAELIGGAQWDVGASGTVMAEEHNAPNDEVEFIYGIRIDNGYGTSRVANNAEKQALDLKNVRILITNKIFNKVGDLTDMLPLFENLSRDNESHVVLLARAFDESCIGWLANNLKLFAQNKSGIAVYPINAPYVDMDEVMEDLAAATGSRFIDANERNMKRATVSDVGRATKVFCTRDTGIVTGHKPGENEIIDGMVKARVANIEEKLTGKVSEFEKRNLETRKAQLTAGTAIIKVGAETEQERKYKKDKVDDCVNTVKAAIVSGVVPGAGLALHAIALENPTMSIADALRAPHRQIVANAGGELEIPEWVQDPLKVVKTAFEKASSIARSLATVEVLTTWEWEKPTCGGGVTNVAAADE